VIGSDGCHVRLLACGASVLIGVAGCASRTVADTAASGSPTATTPTVAGPASSLGPAPPGFPPATSFSTLTVPEIMPEEGITFDVPTAGALTTATPNEAYVDSCSTDGDCDKGSAPTIQLAVVTDPNSGQLSAGGSLTPVMDHTLAYVLTWTNLPCAPAGAVVGATPTLTTCTQVDFVDANTGKTLLELQHGGPNDMSPVKSQSPATTTKP
jgi:hypothetical protein